MSQPRVTTENFMFELSSLIDTWLATLGVVVATTVVWIELEYANENRRVNETIKKQSTRQEIF